MKSLLSFLDATLKNRDKYRFFKRRAANSSVSFSAIINEKKADIVRHMVPVSKDDAESVQNYWVRISQHMKKNDNNKNKTVSLEPTIL